jgi:UDP-N-acetylglucosamine--N-acetylmuramyl-(pentapeptide) pyrophosphoryl-undecaprenol N-acetylglucosamine transferase
MMSVLLGKPLVLHEQNSRAGMANRVLATVADRVFTAFPNVLSKAAWVGNPLREGFLRQRAPADRLAGRSGPLRLLVVGGSLGAQALNEIVPKALALMPPAQRPTVTHQSGARQIDALRANYVAAGVQAVWHFTLIRARTREGCFRAFALNHWLGFTVFLGVAGGYALR